MATRQTCELLATHRCGAINTYMHNCSFTHVGRWAAHPHVLDIDQLRLAAWPETLLAPHRVLGSLKVPRAAAGSLQAPAGSLQVPAAWGHKHRVVGRGDAGPAAGPADRAGCWVC